MTVDTSFCQQNAAYPLPHLCQHLFLPLSGASIIAQGCKPQLLPFPPYTCAQIGAVLRARLSRLPGKVFTPPAIMLCARKVRHHCV